MAPAPPDLVTPGTAGHLESATGLAVDDAAGIAAFKQAHFKELNVPRAVVAGETFSVSGVLHWDFFGSNNIECRAVADPEWGSVRRNNVGKLDHCQNAPFSITLRAPQTPGETKTLAMKAQNNPPLSDWETNQLETFQIEVVTTTQRTAERAVQFAPWVVGGGIGGFALSRTTPDLPRWPTTAVGAGVGAVGKLVWDDTAEELRGIDVPLVEVVAITAALAAGGFLLNQTTGFVSLLSPQAPPRR